MARNERSLTLQREDRVTVELVEKGNQARNWIEKVLKEKIQEVDLGKALQNGVLLCRTIRTLRPDLINQIHETTQFKSIENINNFLNACKKLGVPDRILFSPTDLYDGKNYLNVIRTIHSLSIVVDNLGLEPVIEGAQSWVNLQPETKSSESSSSESSDKEVKVTPQKEVKKEESSSSSSESSDKEVNVTPQKEVKKDITSSSSEESSEDDKPDQLFTPASNNEIKKEEPKKEESSSSESSSSEEEEPKAPVEDVKMPIKEEPKKEEPKKEEAKKEEPKKESDSSSSSDSESSEESKEEKLKEEVKKEVKKEEPKKEEPKKQEKKKSSSESSSSSSSSEESNDKPLVSNENLSAQRRTKLEALVNDLSKQIKGQVERRERLQQQIVTLRDEVETIKKARAKNIKKFSDSLKEGWLEKKGVRNKIWSKKYFVLSSETKMIYFADVSDKESKGSISLENTVIFAHVEKKGKTKPLLFNIRTIERDYLLRASTTEEKDDWAKILKANIKTTDKKPGFSKSGSFLGKTTEERKEEQKKKEAESKEAESKSEKNGKESPKKDEGEKHKSEKHRSSKHRKSKDKKERSEKSEKRSEKKRDETGEKKRDETGEKKRDETGEKKQHHKSSKKHSKDKKEKKVKKESSRSSKKETEKGSKDKEAQEKEAKEKEAKEKEAREKEAKEKEAREKEAKEKQKAQSSSSSEESSSEESN